MILLLLERSADAIRRISVLREKKHLPAMGQKPSSRALRFPFRFQGQS